LYQFERCNKTLETPHEYKGFGTLSQVGTKLKNVAQKTAEKEKFILIFSIAEKPHSTGVSSVLSKHHGQT